jgi:hypothetical protein
MADENIVLPFPGERAAKRSRSARGVRLQPIECPEQAVHLEMVSRRLSRFLVKHGAHMTAAATEDLSREWFSTFTTLCM